MSIQAPASAIDLKNYIKAKLGHDVIRIEMSEDQYEIVISDTMQKFFNYTFDGYEEVFIDATFPLGTHSIVLDIEILNVIKVMGSKTITNIPVSMMVLNVENMYFNRIYTFNFSRMNHTLTLYQDFNTDTNVLLHAYKKLDEVEYTDIYNHPWVKKYSVALAKYQWGQNIIKYNNVILPGEMQLNGNGIIEEGKREIEEAEKELYESWAFFPLPQVL
jgi:hypothetical protein